MHTPAPQHPVDESAFPLDPLSPQARAVLGVNVTHAYAELVPASPGPQDARSRLETLDAGNLLARFPAHRDAAELALSALWLWHDFLHESHAISQRIDTPEGAYWHGIMHRREGDFPNAKYWFRRAGVLNIFPTLAARVDDLIRSYPFDKGVFRLTSHGWDPCGYVDLVATSLAAPADDPRRTLAVAVQRLEWRVLFDDRLRRADV